MDRRFTRLGTLLFGLLAFACSPIAPPPDHETPGDMARQIVQERLSAVVVTKSNDIGNWLNRRFAIEDAPGDADGGSAAPITEDGYFLTADHVLARSDKGNVFIIYGNGGRVTSEKARIVWRSAGDDLALLHIPRKTPYFYHWTPPRKWLSPGQHLIHGGMSTGFKSPPGRLRTALSPQGQFTGNRKFKIDIPLKPGDSGGPIVNARGQLIGINSAVEFLVPLETPIFIDSEGTRPHTGKLAEIIQTDRAHRTSR